MKKIFLLLVLLLSLSIQPVYAVELPSRYLWLESSDIINFYLDTETIKYQKTENGQIDVNTVDVWLLYTYSDSQRTKRVNMLMGKGISAERAEELAYSLLNFEFRLKRQEAKIKTLIDTDLNGQTIKSFKGTNEYGSLVPGGNFETVVRKISDYVRLHHAEILGRS